MSTAATIRDGGGLGRPPAPRRQNRRAATAARAAGPARRTSSIVVTKCTVMSRRRSSLMSSLMFFSFCRAARTWRCRRGRRQDLLLDAADRQHLSAQGDLPGHREIALTGRPVISEAMAVTMATPADGPSFGMAPDGTWRWSSASRKEFAGDAVATGIRAEPRQRRRADSFITSPRWPVSVSSPRPACGKPR